MLSFDNHPLNVPLSTLKMHYGAIFQPAIPEPWQACFYTARYTNFTGISPIHFPLDQPLSLRSLLRCYQQRKRSHFAQRRGIRGRMQCMHLMVPPSPWGLPYITSAKYSDFWTPCHVMGWEIIHLLMQLNPPPSLCPVPARGREARKRHPSNASRPIWVLKSADIVPFVCFLGTLLPPPLRTSYMEAPFTSSHVRPLPDLGH